jgi:hypothetical protein
MVNALSKSLPSSPHGWQWSAPVVPHVSRLDLTASTPPPSPSSTCLSRPSRPSSASRTGASMPPSLQSLVPLPQTSDHEKELSPVSILCLHSANDHEQRGSLSGRVGSTFVTRPSTDGAVFGIYAGPWRRWRSSRPGCSHEARPRSPPEAPRPCNRARFTPAAKPLWQLSRGCSFRGLVERWSRAFLD